MSPFGTRRTHHVHVRVPRDTEAELSFRHLRRANPALALQYAMLNDGLAARHPDNRDAYREGKAAYVAEALGRNA